MATTPTVDDFRAIARGFPMFNTREVNDFIRQFQLFDTSKDGSIDTNELRQMMNNLGEEVDDVTLTSIIREVDADKSGTVEFSEFLQLMANVKAGKDSALGRVVKKAGDMYAVQGSSESVTHSFSEEEVVSFSNYINDVLSGDSDLSHVLPLDSASLDLFNAVKDGILLCKLINASVPSTIDVRAINTKKLNTFKINENLTLGIASARAIGVETGSIGGDDFAEGKQHIVLGVLWQIIRIGLMNAINLNSHPELYRLLEDGETMEDLLALTPEQLLLRWVNYHLRAAEHAPIRNFGKDISDSDAYTTLLNQLDSKCTLAPLQESDITNRAELMLQEADKLDSRKFIAPSDVVSGNRKLNLAFVAQLFNSHPGLAELEEEELEEVAAVTEGDLEGDREARAFALWLNSLNLDAPYVTNLFENLRDGLVLLRAFDAVDPGIVHWPKVNQKLPVKRFKALENCNTVIVLGKQLRFSLVGIAGSDIQAGSRTLTLAVVWQLMRENLLRVLTALGGGKKVTDDSIIAWCNETVTGSSSIESFRDPSLSTGLFFLDLIEAIVPGSVEAEYVAPGNTEEEKLANAQYAIALARRAGAVLFAAPEDIVDVLPKLMLTLCASLMSLARNK